MTINVEKTTTRDVTESLMAAAREWSFSQQSFGVNISCGWIDGSQHTRGQPHFFPCDGMLIPDLSSFKQCQVPNCFRQRRATEILSSRNPLSHGMFFWSASRAVKGSPPVHTVHGRWYADQKRTYYRRRKMQKSPLKIRGCAELLIGLNVIWRLHYGAEVTGLTRNPTHPAASLQLWMCQIGKTLTDPRCEIGDPVHKRDEEVAANSYLK